MAYLELVKGEAAAEAGTAVVLNGRALHNGPQQVDGAGSDLSGLCAACDSSRCLLAGLFHQEN